MSDWKDIWEKMIVTPIVFGSVTHWQFDDPFVKKSQEVLGEELTKEDLREFIPEVIDPWGDLEAPIGSMFSFLDHLTPEQLATFSPGEGGLTLAFYMLSRGDPSFATVPGAVYHTFNASGVGFSSP